MRRLGKVPQKVANRAARAGATIAYKSAKLKAPEDTGELRKGIILKGERRSKPGKKMYGIMLDPAKNHIFVKVSEEGKRSYYPASQEYGYMLANGGFHPGAHYLRDSIDENRRAIEERVVEIALKEVDKAWNER
jgi:hypothetical protein